jgi:hypothetical protein
MPMKTRPLAIAAALALAVPATALAADDHTPKQADGTAAAFALAATPGQAVQSEVEPQAIPAVIAGVAARQAGKWAAKKVAEGALREAGRQLIGGRAARDAVAPASNADVLLDPTR